MAPAPQHRHHRILTRYTDQPARLPADLRHAIERGWNGQPVQLYGLADLDASLRLARTWVALGPEHVAIVREGPCGGAPDITNIPRRRILDAVESPGLSCNVLAFLGAPDEPALAMVRYSQRQRRAMENVRFVLAQAAGGASRVGARDADVEYARAVAGPITEAQALVAANDVAVLWRLLGYLRPYRWRVAVGLGAASLITLLSLVPPFLAGYVMDGVVRPVQQGALPPSEGLSLAWLAVAAIGGALVLRQLNGLVRLRVMSVLGEYVARDLRTALYEHLQRLSLSFYSRKKTGGLITRVSADTDRLWEFLAVGVVDVSLALVMLVGLGGVLIGLDWQLGLIMVTPVPFLCLAIFWHGRQMSRLFTRAWRKWSRVTDVLSDTIPGMRVVIAFNQERRESRRFGQRNSAVTEEFTRIHHAWTAFWPALMLAIHGTTVVVWAVAVPRLVGADAGASLSVGTFVSFLLYMTMFIAPIETIGQMARIMNRATSSAHRVFEVLDTEPEIVDAPEPERLEPVRGRVAFRNVTFGYDGVRQVLRGVTFDARPGEMIGLVGPSGGGKSTIVNLIARFYDPTGGAVLIDGVDLRRVDTGHYRRQMGMVLQDPYLFHGSVLENIRYGNPDATAEHVVAAARAANAHEFVCRLPQGYDTLVGERGHTLSGGERQRVSIARAVLCDPRILILDEATSSVDTETERRIQEAIDRLIAGRTVFAIAHRLSTLVRADRLLVINDGRIIESGTHAELLADPGSTYRRLYEMQRELQRAV